MIHLFHHRLLLHLEFIKFLSHWSDSLINVGKFDDTLGPFSEGTQSLRRTVESRNIILGLADVVGYDEFLTLRCDLFFLKVEDHVLEISLLERSKDYLCPVRNCCQIQDKGNARLKSEFDCWTGRSITLKFLDVFSLDTTDTLLGSDKCWFSF